MSRHIEIQPVQGGMVRIETWMDGRCMRISEALSREDAEVRIAKLTDIEIIDHSQYKFTYPDIKRGVKFV